MDLIHSFYDDAKRKAIIELHSIKKTKEIYNLRQVD